ncbi:MAG: histidine phosphatase family protein [bacterium]|nr:histidine phosphatase family protein [bacterium]
MRVYFVRHGESEFNAQGLHQHPEVPLSGLGRRQAEVLAKRFARTPIDLVLSSHYLRAKETAEIINREVAKPIEYLEDLYEMKRPTEIEGRHMEDPDVMELKQRIFDNYGQGDWRHSDEETFNEFRDRAGRVLAHLERRTEECILVVTHGMLIKMIVASMLFGPSLGAREFLPFYYGFRSSNTGITLTQYREGTWRLITWNDLAHLDNLE